MPSKQDETRSSTAKATHGTIGDVARDLLKNYRTPPRDIARYGPAYWERAKRYVKQRRGRGGGR